MTPSWHSIPYERVLRDLGTGEEVHQMDTSEILHAMTWLRRKETGQ